MTTSVKRSAPYLGWTNWETWNTHLWLTNDESVYQSAVRLAGARDQQGIRVLATDIVPGDEGIDFRAVNWGEIVDALNE